jgi:protein TonB
MHAAASRPSLGSRIAGAAAAIGVTSLVAAMAGALAGAVNPAPESPPLFAAILDPPEPELPAIPLSIPVSEIRLSAPIPDPELPDFEFEATVELPASASTISSGGASPVQVSGASERSAVIVEPVMKDKRIAAYPRQSRIDHETGTTTLRYCVTKTGKVRDVKMIDSSGYRRLDDAAVAWIRTREYVPGTIDGAPTEMCGALNYIWGVDLAAPQRAERGPS